MTGSWHSTGTFRRRNACLTLSIVAVAALASVSTSVGARAASPGHTRSNWVASWTASPHAPGSANPQGRAGFDHQTIRNIVFNSVGGNRVRVHFSNAFDHSTLIIGRASVGVAGLEASVVPSTLRSLTFGGKAGTAIPVGAEAVSDPVALRVTPLEDLSVSVYVPHATGQATGHTMAAQDNYISGPGDFASKASAKPFTTTTTSWYFVDAVDVLAAPRVRGAVVAVGDSITDGNASGLNANGRWPNWLARRLDARSGATLSSVDEGIEGNRLTLDSPCFGVSMLSRIDRDVIAQTGVRNLIVFEGINDIEFPKLASDPFPPATHKCFLPPTHVTVALIIAADKQIIARAHAHGIKVFGATLTPFGGASGYTRAGEAERQAVNAWIRSSHAFDGVFDFDKAVRDPSDPTIINPTYAAPDNIHMNDIGYKALADAVNVPALLR